MQYVLAVLMSFLQPDRSPNYPPDSLQLRQQILALQIEDLAIDNIHDVGAEYCLVAVTMRPNIKIQVWLPKTGWNGRFLGTGNGGSGGKIITAKLADGVKKGFATANTDLGTSGGVDEAIHQPDRWADFGYRATHLMTVLGKQIVTAYYGKAPHHSYFVGCSTGGQQALMEAQRFPDDYNGIIAGAPANNRTHLHAQLLFNYLTAKGIFPPISFNSPAQKAALQKIRKGPVNPRTGAQIYCGVPAGTEHSDKGIGFTGSEVFLYPFRWVFGADYDYSSFDFDKDLALIDSLLGPVLNATDPDLRPFKKAGGKLIMYTGKEDGLVPACDAIEYYNSVKDKEDFFQYYIIPGMCHCGAGGIEIGQIVNWVEHGMHPGPGDE
ncbi:tannase/feruloyl esterase family alpha/beta hydrolase [Chitinophaga silvisoli]|uniref:Tannase/feruloyl esterase family alpha/beta hydrolase n=1 Tax=Chitinophaga silvisoli TaxID=2291814 RepID=A0A3E1P058_9BACT|nr:tannase/feruloyl esterase family alpha/beta hydrolase [Chitinophaga silvisoli]RFM33577.1 tannase/feruloyl esterase family alpha/beta hydrolase [Chitinophaga silvisoli]